MRPVTSKAAPIKKVTSSEQDKMSPLEKQFVKLWGEMYPYIKLKSQVEITPERRYKLDFAHISSQVGIEIQGGTWVKSRHTTGSGLRDSYEKLNIAITHGWVVFQLSSDMINDTWLTVIFLTIKDRYQEKHAKK